MTVRYLTTEDLLLLVDKLKAGPLRDAGLLGAAASRPQATLLGRDAYPTLPLKAAALLHSITNNHALVDGNKRLAWSAAVVFLDINGWQADISDNEAYDLVVAASTGLLDASQISKRMGARPID